MYSKQILYSLIYFILLSTVSQNFYAQAPFGTAGTHTAVPKDTPNIPFGYYEYLPTDFNPTTSKTYPLILFYHGLGEKGNGTTELSKLLVTGVPRYIAQGNTFEAIVISPQSSSGWFSSANFLSLYNYIISNYPIDANRVYVTGLSAGGGSTWNALKEHSDKIAAAVPICGAGRVQDNASTLQQTPIWAHHNFEDKIVTIGQTINNMNRIAFIETSVMSVYPYGPNRTVADADYSMQFNTASNTWTTASGVNAPVDHLAFTLYKNGGHDAWTKTYNNQDVWNWMFAQRLNTLALNDLTNTSHNTIAYPNPTQNTWHISNPNNTIESVRVINNLGKTVIELPANKNNIIIDASPFKSGVYFVELKTINGFNNIKLIKL